DIRAGRFAWDLATDANGRIAGVVTHDADTGWRLVTAAQVILATGGCGQVYSQTSNPPEATGDGIAMAGRAGAPLADMAFVQFHPTALAVSGARQLPLLTEALRGEGARLVNAAGEPIMAGEHPAGELAPRDVVARAVWRRRAAGEAVYLDARKIDRVADRFPTVTALCAEHGLDPRRDLLPIAPAAHYLMGGVATDLDGRTGLPGLWAVGEAARTGVHGANRLASNSLLECVVFALRVAHAIAAENAPAAAPAAPALPSIGDARRLPIDAMRQMMYAKLGLARDAAGIAEAAAGLDRLNEAMAASRPLDRPDHAAVRAWGEARNLLSVSQAIARDAAARPASMGAHYRSDATIPN
ncbi:MAG: FAD-binding protein, partial [Alphaproteobacteria bacterium]